MKYTTVSTTLFLACLLPRFGALAIAEPLSTGDGLAARADGTGLGQLSLDGSPLNDVSVETAVLDPRTGQVADGFTVDATWTAAKGCLRLEGEVRAPGREDTVGDLVIRVRGAELPRSTMEKDPLLLPDKLVSKLPLVSLRAGGEDRLALAVPPDRLTLFRFAQTGDGVELRYPFGFTSDARPELQMRAPFACVLYRTEPKWHFRSALKRYYALFPEPFAPFTRKSGGWLFAAMATDVPNPQHFHYHAGGPVGWSNDAERGLGTYPYQEASSWTLFFPSNQPLPKSYAEAMERLAAMEERSQSKPWALRPSSVLDSEVKRTGVRSLRAEGGTTGDWIGARQDVVFDQPVNEPIVVRGFSKAEGISGTPDRDYALYVDVLYTSGKYLFGQHAAFSTGTHDWEAGELTIHPNEPVAKLQVHCLLRGHQGKAWFDDIHVGPAAKPEVNWLADSGFEETVHPVQYVRNNVCLDSRGEYVVRITDNVSGDIGPPKPMNLLRFTLNVDPDLPDTAVKPSVAGRLFAYYDRVFREVPSLEGCYIDGASSWCYQVLNCRRDQWMAHGYPFAYDETSFRVGAPGRFAMCDFLSALQRRYHPLGKAVVSNIHVSLEAFPLYLVSDVPGIESSRFLDQDSTFFYRACAPQKPVLLMNYMNLHGLDKREMADLFYQNAAQWGELPSTGRYVQEAYRLFGDISHVWMPAIQELNEAGWEPVPLAVGAQAERFPAQDAVYFTVRAPQADTSQTLTIDPAAVKHLGGDLLAVDAVKLCPMAITKQADAWTLDFAHGQGHVTVVRIGTRASTDRWLLRRASRHLVAAGRVRGHESETPELAAARQSVERLLQADHVLSAGALSQAQEAMEAALRPLPTDPDSLFTLSARREIQQAREALSALANLAN